MHLDRARPDAARDLADDDRGAVAEQDASGTEPVGAEIDEAADGPLRAGKPRDRDLVQPVLRRKNEAIGREMGQQAGERRLG